MRTLKSFVLTPIDEICAAILLISSSLFMANVTAFSPIYFLFVLFNVFLLCYFFCQGKLKTFPDLRFLFFIVFFIGIFRILNYILFKNALKENLLQFFSVLYLPLTLLMLDSFTEDCFIKVLKRYFLFTDLFLFADLLFRFVNRTNDFSGILFFYNFKKNGMMFQDSNFSAFLGMINFGAKLYFKTKTKLKFFSGITFFLTFLNLSRASWIGLILSAIIYIFLKVSPKTKIKLIITGTVFTACICLYVLNKTINDYSFLTKFEIFNATFNSVRNSNVFNLLFGYGVESSKDVLNIGFSAHNYFSRSLVETGLIGILLYFVLFIVCIFISNGYVLIILLPYLIAGLSMCPSCCPYFFAMIACIIKFESNEWRIKCN